ncbi:MAG: ABC transporter ATP-binding protein [Longimicrobiales bacterium]
MTMVHLNGVSRTYREGETPLVVLDGVNAAIGRGEFVALVGPSGSGKSTLLNVIGGIDRPDSGSVTVGNVELTSLDERERTLFRRRHIGFVFQFFNLIPTLTVEENLRLPLELNGLPSRRSDVEPWLERVGLAERAGSYPDRLSGGEQQRVAIARALVHEPLVVLADEPTGNVDARTGEIVLDLLVSLTRDAGRTLIVATHGERVVQRADRILALERGTLVDEGVPR